MKKLKILLSNFSDENNLSDSVSIIYNKYKKDKNNVNNGPNLKRLIKPIKEKSSSTDENLINNLSNEEIKIQNNNDKVLNIMDKVSNSYLKIYKLLESHHKTITDILMNINSDNIMISVKKQKLVNITKSLMSSIIIIFDSKCENENLFTIFQNKHMIKKGYDLLFCKKGKNIPLYYVNSYRIRFGDQGLGKIVPYEKNLEFKNEYYLGAKFLETNTNEEIKYELKKAIKRVNRLQDYFDTQYTISGAIYNNLRILYD
jgi:hypothetical protein